MLQTYFFFALALLCLVVIPLAPQLLRIRIRLLHWLKWNWAASLLEDYFPLWVLIVRVSLSAIMILLLYLGWQSI